MASAQTTPSETSEARPCSKCGESLDTAGYPRWCKACRKAYKQDYEVLKEGMTETRGFAAGVSAMRECVAAEFGAQASAGFTGYQVEGLVRQMPGPQLPR